MMLLAAYHLQYDGTNAPVSQAQTSVVVSDRGYVV